VEQFWVQAADEYCKRMKPYARLSVHEVADRDPAKAGGIKQALQREGEDILNTVGARDHLVVLDISGEQFSSEQFAETIANLGIQGTSQLAFVVGGSVGVSGEVRDRANLRLSLGKQTLPHNLARIVLLEQVYRAFKIIKHEPYHK
jgi:23S rRNA (pseudouridine1915-N3)-methyltransferase